MSNNKGTDTGTGGFNLDDKANSYDVVPSGDEGLGPIDHRAPFTKGDINVDTTPKDLSEPTKRRLGQYLGDLTKKNYEPIYSQYESFSTKRGDDGKTPARTFSNTNAYTLTNDKQDKLQPSTNPVPALSKGNPNSPTNGNTYIELESKSRAYVDSVQVNSRFSRANDRYKRGGNTGDTVKELYVVGYKDRVMNELEAALNDSPLSPIVGADYMENIGVLMSLRGSGEVLANGQNIDPSTDKQQAGAFIPSPNQLGAVKIQNGKLDPKNILDDLRKINLDRTSKVEINANSWGVLNNVHEPYSGLTVVGMRALVLGLKLGFTGLFGIISSLGSKDRNEAGRSGGFAFDHQEAGPVGTFLKLPKTSFPLTLCVNIGLQLFLGEDPTTELGSALGNAIVGELKFDNADLGRKAIALRNIVRTAEVLTEKIRQLLNKGNTTSTIQDSIELIDVIRNSKLFAALKIFGESGDLWLMRNKPKPASEIAIDQILSADPNSENPVDPYGLTVRSRTNILPKSGITSKQAFGENGLPWKSGNLPSSYLIPKTLVDFAASTTSGGTFNFAQSAPSDKLNIIKDSLNDSDVKTIENNLESEYVPFYFHDLRTNEIVAFHAFLTNLNESYSAQYSSDEGFGRIDPVRTYRSTTRRIELSFMVVATNHNEDFDTFWYKINKLTTLLYPQYTLGKTVQDNFQDPEYRFVQPFSQLIGASPMIRLRIGDLITSNYSKFALMRLFGFGEVSGENNPNILNKKPIKYKSKKEASQSDYSITPGSIVFIPIETLNAMNKDVRGLSAQDRGTLDGVYAKYSKGTNSVNGQLKDQFKFTDVKGETEKIVDDPATRHFLSKIVSAIGGSSSDFYYTATSETDWNEKFSELRLSPKEKEQRDRNASVNNASIQNDTNALTELASFFSDSSENAIVKAFKATGGRGLAGFIESMNFDWFSNVTWHTGEKGQPYKAPKVCKITMSFSPIHDISPGLSYSGANRAPIYPIGSHLKSYNRKNDK